MHLKFQLEMVDASRDLSFFDIAVPWEGWERRMQRRRRVSVEAFLLGSILKFINCCAKNDVRRSLMTRKLSGSASPSLSCRWRKAVKEEGREREAEEIDGKATHELYHSQSSVTEVEKTIRMRCFGTACSTHWSRCYISGCEVSELTFEEQASSLSPVWSWPDFRR